MTTSTDQIDLEKALHDPSQFFDMPQDVLRHAELSADEKLRILRQWEIDAREMSVAEGENMAGGEQSRLGRVLEAIHELTGAGGDEPSSPFKQGIPPSGTASG